MNKTLISVVALFSASSTAQATTTFGSSFVATSSYAQVSGPSKNHVLSGTPYGTSLETAIGTNSVQSYFSDTSSDGSASDAEETTLSFTNPGQFNLQFTGTTSASVNALQTVAEAGTYYGGPYAEYAFSTDEEESISIEADLSGNPIYYEDGALLNLYYVEPNGQILGALLAEFGENSTGSYRIKINPGMYIINIGDFQSPDFITLSSPGAQTGGHIDSFDVSISPGPEPSTWTLLIAGVAMIGSALRYRRRNGASAIA